ncbi:BnaA10g06620D [Brassica napus]|nr:BnaA10g06620D [Brassica napus]
MGLSSRGMEGVIDQVRNKHYQLACTMTFEAVYGTSCDAGINHPNQYFEESRKILKSKTPLLREDNLRAALGRMGLSSRGMEGVIDQVRNKHYQLACTMTFEAVYGTSCDAGINHPNQYFEESRKILKSKTPLLRFKL